MFLQKRANPKQTLWITSAQIIPWQQLPTTIDNNNTTYKKYWLWIFNGFNLSIFLQKPFFNLFAFSSGYIFIFLLFISNKPINPCRIFALIVRFLTQKLPIFSLFLQFIQFYWQFLITNSRFWLVNVLLQNFDT